MAGSKKWFIYTIDQGTDFALLADESNTEALNAGTQDYVDGLTIQIALPRNITPRAAVYANAAKTRVIRCYALTQSIYNGALTNQPTIDDPIGTGSLALIRLEPERIRILPVELDTGLTDGDAT
jgi:hypothetical protein